MVFRRTAGDLHGVFRNLLQRNVQHAMTNSMVYWMYDSVPFFLEGGGIETTDVAQRVGHLTKLKSVSLIVLQK